MLTTKSQMPCKRMDFPFRLTNVHNFLRAPWPFIARRVRRLGRWSLTSMEHLCSFGFLNFSRQTLYLQGRLVLALILVQLKKGDSVAASKVGLLRHPGERILQLAHGLGFSVLVNSSGLAAVGWLLWWCTGSSCKLVLSPSKFWVISSLANYCALIFLFLENIESRPHCVTRALVTRTGRLHSRGSIVLLSGLLTMTMWR